MKYKLNTEDILITQLGDEGVAFNSITNEYFSLNETSFKILKDIENGLSFRDICDHLKNEYEVPATDCEKEVNNTIQFFLSKMLIQEI